MTQKDIRIIADYLCLRCRYVYQDDPGPTQCPKCGHLYIKWLNYKDLNRRFFKN